MWNRLPSIGTVVVWLSVGVIVYVVALNIYAAVSPAPTEAPPQNLWVLDYV